MMADIADYDEFLTGKRRESQYMMAIEFLPKFLEVISEALPFVLLAYFGYRRDDTDGQPLAVEWLLRLCFSFVPAGFVLAGTAVLCQYPVAARKEEAHKKLMVAITEFHQRGKEAEDPWFPGRVLPPPSAPGLHVGLLSHFLPSEVLALLSSTKEDEDVNYGGLRSAILRWTMVVLPLAAGGVVLLVLGWDDLSDDLGASVSPIGLVLFGMAMLITWFQCVRLRVLQQMVKLSVPRNELVMHYNFLCRFTGDVPFPAPMPHVVPTLLDSSGQTPSKHEEPSIKADTVGRADSDSMSF